MTFRLAGLTLLLAGTASVRAAMTFDNQPVPVLDAQHYAGKWYSLLSIPTPFDKDWLKTIEYYTPRRGGFDVRTTYRREGENKLREISSRLFVPKRGPQGALKAQFWWPIRVPYTMIALSPNDSWMIGGAPDKKMLFILSRTPSLPTAELEEIVQRCEALGYPVEKLKSQEHWP